ncbi:MAG TPA: hypothetical protein GXZ76_08365 [Clostridiaceae bacterium]|nr:hypothetical protein [Clostridiaceae bacterium]
MKKQRLIVIFVVLIMAFLLMACNKKTDDSDPIVTNGKDDVTKTAATESEKTEDSKAEESEEAKETEAKESKTAKATEAKESKTVEKTEEVKETKATESKDTKETEKTDTDQATPGLIYETEEFSVSVPEGWLAHPMVSADGEESTNKVNLFKGDAEDPFSLIKAPVINLEYGDPDISLTKTDKKFYDGAVDIDPIEIGGKSFSGFTAKSSDLPLTCLYAEDGDKQYQVYVWTEKPGGSISLEDADVIQIIESFQGK